jgi:hypothetical protein
MKMTKRNIHVRELLTKARKWMPADGRFDAVRYLYVPLWKPWRDSEH